MVQTIMVALMIAKMEQETIVKMWLPWALGEGLESKRKDGTNSKYIADITFHDLFNNPLIIFEMARSQSREEALAKITARLANNPKLLGACVISAPESPIYKNPERIATKHDALFMPSWMEAVKGSPEFGPINYRGFCWLGSITCYLDVRLKGENRPRAEKIVSLLHPYFLC
jgi:hypothetical protein